MANSAEFDKPNGKDEASAITADTGIPRYNRRLSDKILAAFNHAYAVGEIDIAARLREILARLDTHHSERSDQRRRDGAIALSQADLWIEFVEARNDYRAACDSDSSDPIALDCMLEVMKGAYKRWSAL